MTTKNIGLLGQSYPIITSAEAPLLIENGVISDSGGGGGGVTSVGLVMPTDVFNVANSPITTSGDLIVTFDNQTANLVFASPSSGGAGQPAFRALVVADVPTLNQNTTGNALTATTATNLALPYSATNSTTANYTLKVTNSHTTVLSDFTEGAINGISNGQGVGLFGQANSDSGTAILGYAIGNSAKGVYGYAVGSGSYGVYSEGNAYVHGQLNVTGTLVINTGTNGVLKAASGVISGSAASTDLTDSTSLATLTGIQTLTNKTLTSPTLTTPALGVATATSINGLTVSTSTGTLTIANGKTLTVNNSLTFAGNDDTTQTFQASDTIVGRATTDTLTNKTLTAPKFASGGFIADANGNELFIFTTTASAVNEITYKNNSTGNNPTFTASGGDSNIGFTFTPKGSGNTVISTGTLTVGGYSYASGGSAGFGAGTTGQSFFVQDSSGNLCSIPSRRETIGKTADYTVTGYNDSNGVLHNNGAAGTIVMTLPSTPAIGNHYVFYVLTAQILRVKAGGASATIRLGASVSAANGTIESSTIGNSIHIHYIASNQWVVTAHEGTWTIT